MKTFKDLQINDILYQIELTEDCKFVYAKHLINKIDTFETVVFIQCNSLEEKVCLIGSNSIQKCGNTIYAADKQALINYFINIISVINLK